MLIYLFIGAACGLCSSAPLGPINLWLASATIERGEDKNLTQFIAGVICADLCFAAIAAVGHRQLSLEPPLTQTLNLLGGAFLILVGLLNLRSIAGNKSQKVEHRSARSAYANGIALFFIGCSLCASNPAFLLFWFFIFDSVAGMMSQALSPTDIGAFLAGVAIGDYIWFKTLIRLARLGKDRLGERIVDQIRISIALLLIAAGSYTIYNDY